MSPASAPQPTSRSSQRKITRLEQQVVDVTGHLEECQADLEAARDANRELTRALNQTGGWSPKHPVMGVLCPAKTPYGRYLGGLLVRRWVPRSVRVCRTLRPLRWVVSRPAARRALVCWEAVDGVTPRRWASSVVVAAP